MPNRNQRGQSAGRTPLDLDRIHSILFLTAAPGKTTGETTPLGPGLIQPFVKSWVEARIAMRNHLAPAVELRMLTESVTFQLSRLVVNINNTVRRPYPIINPYNFNLLDLETALFENADEIADLKGFYQRAVAVMRTWLIIKLNRLTVTPTLLPSAADRLVRLWLNWHQAACRFHPSLRFANDVLNYLCLPDEQAAQVLGVPLGEVDSLRDELQPHNRPYSEAIWKAICDLEADEAR